MAELQQTVSDNPAQVARLKGIENTINDWVKNVTEPAISLRRSVAEGNGSLAEIEALVQKERGKKYFDAFRAQITEFSDIEFKLMSERQKALQLLKVRSKVI